MSSTLSETPPAAPKPFLTIKPGGRWAALNLKEVWQFRDLLLTLAGRDVKLRYRQTALGAAWVVLQPLIAAGITSFVFNKVAKLPTGGRAAVPVRVCGLSDVERVQRHAHQSQHVAGAERAVSV